MVESVYFVVGALLIATLFFLPVFPSFVLIDWIDDADRFPQLQGTDVPLQLLKYFDLAFPATGVLIVCTALLSAGIRWTVLPRLKPGSSPDNDAMHDGDTWLGSGSAITVNSTPKPVPRPICLKTV